MPALGPLTDTDYRGLNVALGMVAQKREELQKAADIGLPVEEPMAVLDAMEHVMLSIKRSYFPDRP